MAARVGITALRSLAGDCGVSLFEIYVSKDAGALSESLNNDGQERLAVRNRRGQA